MSVCDSDGDVPLGVIINLQLSHSVDNTSE